MINTPLPDLFSLFHQEKYSFKIFKKFPHLLTKNSARKELLSSEGI